MLTHAQVEKVREIHFANYSEAASTRVQIAVLFTLAQLRIHAHKGTSLSLSLVYIFVVSLFTLYYSLFYNICLAAPCRHF